MEGFTICTTQAPSILRPLSWIRNIYLNREKNNKPAQKHFFQVLTSDQGSHVFRLYNCTQMHFLTNVLINPHLQMHFHAGF